MSLFAKVWWLSLAVKVFVALLLPLSTDEAYYWVWSHHLQLGYFDHPPMIAFWLYLGHFFEGLGYGVRLPGVFIGHLTFLIWDRLVREDLSTKARTTFWLFYLVTPLTGLGGVIMTPDLPLMFFSALTILLFKQVLNTPNAKNYFLLGCILGLGFLSKYHIVLLVPILVGLALYWKKGAYLLKPQMLGLLAGGLLFCSPVLIWNHQNEWISFLFQLNHGFGKTDFDIKTVVDYLGGQALLIHPFLFVAVYRAIMAGGSFAELMKFQFLSIFGFFALSSFKGHVEANWTTQAFPALFAGVASYVSDRVRVLYVGFWGVFLVLVVSLWVHPWLSQMPERLQEPHHFKVLVSESAHYSPLYVSHYRTAAMLSYYQKRWIYKLRGSNRFDFYDMRQESIPKEKTFFFIADNDHVLPQMYIEQYQVTKEKEIDGKFTVYRLEAYH